MVVERSLTKLFRAFPNNINLEDVFLKVIVLNDLYRTAIWATYQVAEHIVSLNIDHLIREGKPEAVDMIARIRLGNKIRNNYSFATKYCAWHNPSAYPIYDMCVDKMLWAYRRQDQFDSFLHQDLLKYDRFRQIVRNFQRHYHLTTYNIKDIDKFLWLAGKEYFPAPR
ncbi:MAG: hypothetical protein QXS54_01325 [Candidatus Methanomethylicaceae archaeon]|nr:hypothetical protein [Anaerolineales bacterium]